MQDLPAIRKIPLINVLGEGNRGVTIDRNILKSRFNRICQPKPKIATYGCHPISRRGLELDLNGNVETYCDQVAELKMSSKATCLARNAFLQATVSKECYPIGGQHGTIYCRVLTIGV